MPLVDYNSGKSLRSSQKSMRNDGFSSRGHTNHTEEELEYIMNTFAEKDHFMDKTWSRTIVETFLSKWKWYFPMRDKPHGPSLSKAYAYYEHVTLPRYFSGDQEADTVQRKAEPGESEEDTRLYNPFFASSSAFNEWGIGIDSYFSSLKVVSFMLLAAGLLHWYNMRFFSSSDYSEKQQGKNIDSVILEGSAICTTQEWVACPDCQQDDFNSYDGDKQRFAFATRTSDGTNVTLVVHNACSQDLLGVGMVNYAAFFLLFILLALQALYLRVREIRADEDKLTSSDYSIVVRNPPPDAYDPDEWRDFFDKFSDKQITCVTIAINNETMLKKLIARRIHRNNLRLCLPPGIDMDEEDLVRSHIAVLEKEKEGERAGLISRLASCCILPILNIFNMFLPPQTLFEKVVKLTEEIKDLQKFEYQCTTVFVTFETEEGQRAALEALTTGRVNVMMNNTHKATPGTVFRDRVLQVEEPTEPSAVRWLDLGSTFRTRILMRIVNLAITLCGVVVSGVCVGYARSGVGPFLSGPMVSVFNSIIPQVVKILMMFEPHLTEGSYQTSLYLKITFFRWINTAVLTKFITPFTATLTDNSTDLLPAISAVFWSELFITPALRLLDLGGNFSKHILAPRARTQEQMNANFQGTFYNLGERYTDFTKVLFLCFFYSSLLPSSFIFGFAILLVQHYVDKYCLMRIWGWSPIIGSELAKFSRRYFFFGALMTYALVSAYGWAQFPYDNLCNRDTPNGTEYSGDYTIKGTLYDENYTDQVYVSEEMVFCEQSWSQTLGQGFPASSALQPSGFFWMSPQQETLANVYGWTSMGVFIAFFVILFGSSALGLFMSLFRNTYSPSGDSQRIDFSANPEIFAYVPQIKLPSLPFRLLACDIDNIHQGLVGWNDPVRSYDFYNLMFDVPYPGMKRTERILTNTRATDKFQISDTEEYKAAMKTSADRSTESGVEAELPQSPIFSLIKHYPPPWLKKVFDDQDLVETLVDDVIKEEETTEVGVGFIDEEAEE